MKHRLVAFEGIDGTGKTTLSKGFVKELKRRGLPAIRYEEYEKAHEGFNLIKPFVKKDVSVTASLFFYIASAIHKSAVIEKLLIHQWVVCDRYVYSTLADHGARGAHVRLIPSLKKLPIRIPDLHVLLVTDDDVRLERIRRRPQNAPHDFERKRPGSFPEKMERHLKKYHPLIIDNTTLTVSETLRVILAKMF